MCPNEAPHTTPPSYRPGDLRRHSTQIILARKWAVGAITALLGIGLFVSELARIRQTIADPLSIAYLALFALTGALVFLWIWSTQKELDLLFDWLDPQDYAPPDTLVETISIIGIALILIALLFAARNPLLYGCVFALYSLAQLPICKLMLREIGEAIRKSRTRLANDLQTPRYSERARVYASGIDALEAYYLTSPYLLRLVLIAVFALLGLALSIIWKTTGKAIFGLGAYGTFMSTIAASEIVIGRWRNARDKALRPLLAALIDARRESEEKRWE